MVQNFLARIRVHFQPDHHLAAVAVQLFDDSRLHTVKVHVGVVLTNKKYAGIGQPFCHFLWGQQLAGGGVGNTVEHDRNLPALALWIADFQIEYSGTGRKCGSNRHKHRCERGER